MDESTVVWHATSMGAFKTMAIRLVLAKGTLKMAVIAQVVKVWRQLMVGWTWKHLGCILEIIHRQVPSTFIYDLSLLVVSRASEASPLSIQL